MTPELFWTVYLYMSLFLLPVHLICFLGRSRYFSIHLWHQIHKAVLVMILGIPVAACLILPHAGAGLSRDQVHTIRAAPLITPAIPEGGTLPVNDQGADYGGKPLQNYHQMALGLLYILVGLATFSGFFGLTVFFIRLVIQAGYVRRIRRQCDTSYLHHGYRVFISDRIDLPFSCRGIEKKIFLPKGLTGSDCRTIIHHEIIHFKCRHHDWSLAESLISHLFWFNPVSHVLRRKGCLLREMECDEKSVQIVDKYAYSRLMVETARSAGRSANRSGRLGLMAAQWMQKSGLRERLEHILGQQKPGTQRRLSLALCFAVMLFMGMGIGVILMEDDALENRVAETVNQAYSSIEANGGTVALEQLPEHLIATLIFNEDAGFYTHAGIDLKAVARALVNNLTGGPLQGGSTISQQLVKRLFLENPEKSLARKLKQVKAARAVERRFSKEDILEMYLNSVYFGRGAFGVKAASRVFFHHPPSDLSVAESAMLIQSLTRPGDYNCGTDPTLAEKRTLRLLMRMVDNGLLDRETAEQSLADLRERLDVKS